MPSTVGVGMAPLVSALVLTVLLMQSDVDHVPWHRDASVTCDMDTPLFDVTFCVVDLETTGGSPEVDRITEIGAVKVRGGEVVGEFATLVRPGREMPPEVSALTGITAEMVAAAPSLGSVLPAFLDFAHGSVLVAHNAGFDMSFLRAACQATDRPWPEAVIVDTVRLARLLVPRDEVLNHRLVTLAAWCGATTTPTHRALADARATVDVLHALLGRLTGVQTVDELTAFAAGATTAQQRRRHLARDVPHGPGVYLFADATGRVLYVGSAGDLRARVRSYFNRGEKSRRTAEMVALADAVRHVSWPTLLEARVHEVRLIASLKPTYNRRPRTSRRPPRPATDDQPQQPRGGTGPVVEAAARAARAASLQRTGRLVVAVRDTAGGWEIALLLGARLIGTAVSPPGLHPQPTIDLLVADCASIAECTVDPAQPTSSTQVDPTFDEVDVVWHWLSRPGVRLVEADQGWWLPVGSAAALTERSLPPSRQAGARRARRRSPRGHAPADRAGPT